jgi:hypothetical protein
MFLLPAVLVVAAVAFVSAAPPRATGPSTPHLPSQDNPVVDPSKKMFPLPDLVILEITKGPGARAHIRNQGKANAGSCTLAVNCFLATLQNGSGVQSTGLWQVPALKAGGDTWVSLGKCNAAGGNIDADKTVKESNEANNSYKVKG